MITLENRWIFSSHVAAQGPRRSRKFSNIKVCVKTRFFKKKEGTSELTRIYPPSLAKPCRFFATERGCPKGSLCTLWVKNEKITITYCVYFYAFPLQACMMNCGIRSLRQSKSRTRKKRIVAKITFLSLGVSLEVAFALVSLKRRIQIYTLPPILHAQLTLLQSLKMTLSIKSYFVNVRILTRPHRVLILCNLKWSTYVVPLFASFFCAFKFTNFNACILQLFSAESPGVLWPPFHWDFFFPL